MRFDKEDIVAFILWKFRARHVTIKSEDHTLAIVRVILEMCLCEVVAAELIHRYIYSLFINGLARFVVPLRDGVDHFVFLEVIEIFLC